MKFPCPQCSQRLSADESMVGQSLECPRCGHMLTVPPPEETPVKSAETEWKNPLMPAEDEWENPLKPGKEGKRTPQGGSSLPKKRAGAAVRRSPSQVVVVSNSAGGWTKPLLILALVLGAGIAYWLHSGGSLKPISPPQADLPTTITPEPVTPQETVSETQPTGALSALEAEGIQNEPSTAINKPTEPAAEPDAPPLASSSPTITAPPPETAPSVELESIPLVPATASTSAKDTKAPKSTFPTGNLVAVTVSQRQQNTTLANRKVTLSGSAQLTLTGEGDPLPGSVLNFVSPDAWLFLEKLQPSKVASDLLPRMWVNGTQAELNQNIRVVQYENGTAVIPHPANYPAMTVFNGKGMNGSSMPLTCFTNYNDGSLAAMKGAISSFRLKRGYMATIAQNENGTGLSKNYVAQDKDMEVSSLPPGLDKDVSFVRIFPWRWTGKKGVAGGIWQNLNVDWFYDWNIGANSALDLEYVPIKQKRWWPGLNQDWKKKGSVHLLGYNEPDRPDQAKMTPDEAIAGWPELLGTGLRLGSPAVSDGGLGWLYDFMAKADAAKLRVDFVAVHYYRATPGNNAKAAADQFYGFLKGIHDRTKRPIWITEWNNGANWTGGGDPSASEQKECVEEMIKMLDKTEFVERYAIYNWVEDCRAVIGKDGKPTPAGIVYRDKLSPFAYKQVKP